jgi:Flp pilus assembly protein TadB
MAFRSWRDRLWLGLAIFIGVAVALIIGPAYIHPLPLWLKVLIAVACGLTIASLAVYSRRRVRRV